MNTLLFNEVGQRISWTLVHSLWQFALIAVVLGIGLRLTRNRSPHGRYGVMLAALLFLAITPVVTFFAVSVEVSSNSHWVAGAPINVRGDDAWRNQNAGEFRLNASAIAPLKNDTATVGSLAKDPGPQGSLTRSTTENIRSSIEVFVVDWMHVIVTCWLGGILVLSLRPLIGWQATRRLRSRGHTNVPEFIQAATKRVANRLGIRRVIAVAQSTLVEVPTVIGWLKPLMLLPASAVTGLSTQQLEAVIAHELAHVQRQDYLVNIFQIAMETVFFYHPAVWWVSHRMRIEREDCCDEIAAKMMGDRIGYAKLLLWLEETRQGAGKPSLAMSADGGSLLRRVHRLVSTPSITTGIGPLATATVLVLMSGSVGLVSPNVNHSFAQDSGSTEPSDSAQIRSWISRVIELEEWSRLPGLVVRLAENGEYNEAIDWLSKAPLGSTKEGKFSPGSYSKTIGEICQVALVNDRPQIALDAFDRLTDPDGTPRSAEWDRRASSAYFRAVGDIRSAVLMHHVSKGQLDAALDYLNSQPAGTRGSMVADVAKDLPRRGYGDQAEAFWQRLTDPKLRDTCRFRLATAYYHLNQPDKVWKLADEIAAISPSDLAAEVRTRSTAMKCYSRVAPERFDELLPTMRDKISQLPAADQSRYWEEMALAAARLQRYELTAELSAKVPLLLEAEFRFMDLSGRDRHPILFAITEILKGRQLDQAYTLIDLVEDEAVNLAALARVPTATTVPNNQTKEYPEGYAKSVRRLAEAYRVFAEKHDEKTVRNTVPKLPELLSVHLRRVNSPRVLPNQVAFLNRDLLMRSGAYTDLLIEQGEINEVVELAEKLLGQGDLGFARWMARELAKAGHADEFEALRLKINDAIEKSGAKKHGAPLPPWENRRFLALSAYTAYSAGQRDLCFDIFMKLDRNWMSPSYLSRVAGDAQRAGDIAFLRRMESSTSPLMREAALRALAMHHVLSGKIDEAAVAADTFDKEFGGGNQNWSIYRWISHEKNVKDPNRRIAATGLALRKISMDSKDYAIVARDHAKLLGQLFPAAPLPADWLKELKSDPKLLLQVELDHASGRSVAAAND